MTWIVLAVCFVVFVWYLLADRFTPYTDQATVQAPVVPIVPRVSGYVNEVNVRLHSIVSEGDLLFRLDPRPYELAVRSEAQLDQAAQQVGAQGATVKSAAGRLGVARAQLDRAQRRFDRVQSIQKQNPGALSQADRDRAGTSLAQAVERVTPPRPTSRKRSNSWEPRGRTASRPRAEAAALRSRFHATAVSS